MKKPGLSTVLQAVAKGEEPVAEKRKPTKVDEAENETPKRTYREGRFLVAGYFGPAVKASLRQIQVSHLGKTIQDLLAEALNDLFAKYNVPQSAATQPSRARRAG